MLACNFEDGLKAVVYRGGMAGLHEFYGSAGSGSPYLYLPHDAMFPGADAAVYMLMVGGVLVPPPIGQMTDWGVIDARNYARVGRRNDAACMKWMRDVLNDE